ncbi:hypothetical protein [Grimontia sp. NTOU-MAR1]|uniref:hypothetical protein n=1 Tax=Grimontia sp. NTOU-MAR1 TaxID=3111011 RepID=UPI002DB57D83|nr:hypothetical protein [Grimontia sp. NTOU-MAR1]WRV98261.1 hypothetical protein VP504_02150 [Grimontia sp. NTOU-MAR1]
MGGSSSSSNLTKNTTNTTNLNSSVGVQGANNGVILSGVTDSTINASMTDHGAVSAALQAMSESSSDALESNEAVSRLAISEMGDLSRDIIGQSLTASKGATDAALDVAKNLSLSSDAGTTQTMTKYVALSLAAVGVAVALRGKF